MLQKKSSYPSHLLLLTILWLLVHLLLYWKYGLRNLYDSTDYIRYADVLIRNGKIEDPQIGFYFIPIAMIALFRWLFPFSMIPFIIFQCFISLLATIALYKAASKIFTDKTAGFIAAVVFLLWWDNLHWNVTWMTESLACSTTCFIAYRLTLFSGSAKDWATLIALLIITFFTRPSGIISIVGTIAFFIHYYWPALKSNRPVAIGLFTFLFLLSLWGANSMFAHWDFTDQYKRGNIITYVDTFTDNEQYKSLRLPTENLDLATHGPPILNVLHFIVNNPIHFMQAAFLKVGYLLFAARPYYSNLHNFYAVSWSIFIYGIAFYGWKLSGDKTILVFILSVIIVNCSLIAISTVDWDNRFYIPMEPGIVLLAGGGGNHLVHLLRNHWEKSF